MIPILSVLFGAVFLVFGAYGLLVLLITVAYLVSSDRDPPARADLPQRHVTVQLPLYNEPRVADRAISAACRLKWPRHLFEVQVLDDSTDGTSEVVDRAALRWRSRGIDVSVLRREDRKGYKAGALAAGTAAARGELLAVFDADFVPRPDFLELVLPHMRSTVAAVQTRWGHLNADASALTQVQAMALDGHFVVEQVARSRLGLFVKFNGTAGVWRKSAIVAVGGWQGDTLSEDTDLSYRAQIAGWKILYLRNVVVPAELPETLPAYKQQQRRWAAGTTGVLRKLGPRLARAPLPIPVRAHALLGLAEHLLHPLTVLLILAAPLLLKYTVPFSAAFLLVAVMTLSPSAMYVVALSELYEDWRSRLLRYPLLVLLAVGLSLNGTVAVIRALLGRSGSFERTPKAGNLNSGEGGVDPQTSRMPYVLLALEVALTAYATIGLAAAIDRSAFTLVPLFALFSAGYACNVALTLKARGRPIGEAIERNAPRIPVGDAEEVLHIGPSGAEPGADTVPAGSGRAAAETATPGVGLE